MMPFRKMPTGYSSAKDVLRFVQVVVVELVGALTGVKFLPDTHLSAVLLVIWIVVGSAASVFFIARVFFVFVFRLK
jgi:hypothetical protein